MTRGYTRRRLSSNEPKHRNSLTSHPLRILLADDEPDALSSLTLLLENDGHVVQSVSEGAAVVWAVRKFGPQVCIIDISVPAGYAAAKQLRTTYGPDCPYLIAMSGQWVLATDEAIATSAGFDHFLAKPADPEYLLGFLQELGSRI